MIPHKLDTKITGLGFTPDELTTKQSRLGFTPDELTTKQSRTIKFQLADKPPSENTLSHGIHACPLTAH